METKCSIRGYSIENSQGNCSAPTKYEFLESHDNVLGIFQPTETKNNCENEISDHKNIGVGTFNFELNIKLQEDRKGDWNYGELASRSLLPQLQLTLEFTCGINGSYA